jgi:hypothetical protein
MRRHRVAPTARYSLFVSWPRSRWRGISFARHAIIHAGRNGSSEGVVAEPYFAGQGRRTSIFGVNVPCWSFRGERMNVSLSPLPCTVQIVSMFALGE